MNTYQQNLQLKNAVLSTIEPFDQYGLVEVQYSSYQHALREMTAITYLMGMGYDPMVARRMVESWEINEMFYPMQR